MLAFVQLLALAWRPDHADHDYHAGLRRCPTVAGALSGARRRGRLLGAKDLPTFFRQAAGPGWALVGDAAHHKDPLAARGIADALLGAQLLAEQVLRGADHDLDDALRYYAADLPRRLLLTAQLNDQLAGLDLPIPAARGVLHALWAAEREIATTNLETSTARQRHEYRRWVPSTLPSQHEETKMIIVRAEHEIGDFDTWKAAFDRDPIQRERSGVRRYRVVRPIDDPHFVIMDFEFDTEVAARAFQMSLHKLWASPAAAPAPRGSPSTRLVDPVETKTY